MRNIQNCQFNEKNNLDPFMSVTGFKQIIWLP